MGEQIESLTRDRDRLRDAIDRVMGLTDTGSETYRHAARLYTDGRLPSGQLVSMIRETLLDYAGCNWPTKKPEPLVSYTRNISADTVDSCHEAANWIESHCWEPKNPTAECSQQRDKLRGYALRIRLLLEEHAILSSLVDAMHLEKMPCS